MQKSCGDQIITIRTRTEPPSVVVVVESFTNVALRLVEATCLPLLIGSSVV